MLYFYCYFNPITPSIDEQLKQIQKLFDKSETEDHFVLKIKFIGICIYLTLAFSLTLKITSTVRFDM